MINFDDVTKEKKQNTTQNSCLFLTLHTEY